MSPDAQGNLKGQGWSRKREAGWDRAFLPGYHRCPDCGAVEGAFYATDEARAAVQRACSHPNPQKVIPRA